MREDELSTPNGQIDQVKRVISPKASARLKIGEETIVIL